MYLFTVFNRIVRGKPAPRFPLQYCYPIVMKHTKGIEVRGKTGQVLGYHLLVPLSVTL